MAVDLEALALKSIAQNAELTVRLASIETALIDSARRSEQRDDNISKIYRSVALLEERLNRDIADRLVTDNKVQVLETKVDNLTINVNRLVAAMEAHSNKCTEHIDDHCENCDNSDRIDTLETTSERLIRLVDELEAKVKALTDDPNLNEVRALATSKHGLMFLRFSISRWGIYWMIAVTALAVLAAWSHYPMLKAFWKFITFAE